MNYMDSDKSNNNSDNIITTGTSDSTEHGDKPEIDLPNPSIATPSIPAEMPVIEGK